MEGLPLTDTLNPLAKSKGSLREPYAGRLARTVRRKAFQPDERSWGLVAHLLPLKQLTFHLKRSSAGRNSSGRITVFHRGGGSKRLQRKIDFKRSTSSMGIVERIEYDPNRSSRIALVRWIEGFYALESTRLEQIVEKKKICSFSASYSRSLRCLDKLGE